MLGQKLSSRHERELEEHMKFYSIWDRVYGDSLIELVRKWYQTALALPDNENPLLGDDPEGVLSERFKTSMPSDKTHTLLICGGSWERPALEEGNENKVFIRKARIDTKTVVLVSVINVVLPLGGHLSKEHPPDNNARRRKAVDEMKEAMAIEKVSARFKITGPHNPGSKPVGVYLDKEDLLFLSNESNPFDDIQGNEDLNTDPHEWKTLRMKSGFPSFTSGYYACFELKTPGTYIFEIDGGAPLAGHQDPHIEEVTQIEQEGSDSGQKNKPLPIDVKFFHNSATYVLEVR